MTKPEIIELKKGKSLAHIDPHGGRFSYSTGTVPILTPLGSQRGDGDPASSHPCAPIWGAPAKNYGFTRQHGPARDSDWTIESRSVDSAVLSLTIDAVGDRFPSAVRIRQTFRVTDFSLSLETVYENLGGKPTPTNHGHHLYFSTPAGWETATFDGKRISEEITGNKGYGMTDGNHEITIPKIPRIVFATKGYSYIWMWTGSPKGSDSKDQHYCCIEPLEYNPELPLPPIQPGEKRSHSFTISV